MEFEKLQMIIAEVLGKDSEQIYAKARLVEDLGVDSLEVFQIIMGMEDTFDVILEDGTGSVQSCDDTCIKRSMMNSETGKDN